MRERALALACSVFAGILPLPTLVRYKLLLLAPSLPLLLLLFFVVNCTRMVFSFCYCTYVHLFVLRTVCKLIKFSPVPHSVSLYYAIPSRVHKIRIRNVKFIGALFVPTTHGKVCTH